jgi:hypothetical protein
MICECNVWCTANDQLEGFGIDGGDVWMPIAFLWNEVVCIKEAGRNDFLGEGKSHNMDKWQGIYL